MGGDFTNPREVMNCMEKDCKHDFEHPVRLGRAKYICPKCDKDITLELVFIADLTDPSPKDIQ